MTVQDLKPNSQDTSAFYLGNIYEVLADPNAARASPVAKPPPFSRPRYAIWENSLLFLSLVMSLSCALLATSLQQWARRYIRLTQLARTLPEKRARMRGFYANGVEKMHIPWAVEGLPMLLHLSLFLFFGGLAVFLYNVDVEVFTCVACWIGLFLIVYGLMTLLPLLRYNSPYYTPLSKPVWFLKASIPFVYISALFVYLFFSSGRLSYVLLGYCHDVRWTFRGMEKEAEETAEKQSSEIDVRILDWTISALGDDNSREEFFQTIPGLFSSKEVKNLEKVPQRLLVTFWRALGTFLLHTTNSDSVSKEVKSRRVDIAMDIASMIPCSKVFHLQRVSDYYNEYDPKPVSIDQLDLMTRWIDHESPYVSYDARVRAADMLAGVEERDRRWFAFAYKVSRLSESELRLDPEIARDNMVLATIIDTCRRIIHSPRYEFLNELDGCFISDFDCNIHDTHPRLQHDFCQLWNELVQEAGNPESRYPTSSWILDEIRHLYADLHQGTDAALPNRSNNRLSPSSYPLCGIPGHRPHSPARVSAPNSSLSTRSSDSSSHHSTSGGSIVSRQDVENIITGSPSRPHPTTPSIVEDNSQAPGAADSEPVHATSHPSDASPPGAASQEISPVTMLSHTLEETTQRDTILAAAAASTSASNTFLASSVAGFPIPVVPSPSHDPPLSDVESLAILSNTKHSHPTGNITFLHSRARGLVNPGGMCFSNAVLQLLVHSPPFLDVFRVLGDLKGRLGAGGSETATPLVDATMRFLEEFMFKEKKLPPSQQPPQHTAREIPREDEKEKKEHNAVDSFEPTYMYEAMKEKQLKYLLVRSSDQDAPFYP